MKNNGLYSFNVQLNPKISSRPDKINQRKRTKESLREQGQKKDKSSKGNQKVKDGN